MKSEANNRNIKISAAEEFEIIQGKGARGRIDSIA